MPGAAAARRGWDARRSARVEKPAWAAGGERRKSASTGMMTWQCQSCESVQTRVRPARRAAAAWGRRRLPCRGSGGAVRRHAEQLHKKHALRDGNRDLLAHAVCAAPAPHAAHLGRRQPDRTERACECACRYKNAGTARDFCRLSTPAGVLCACHALWPLSRLSAARTAASGGTAVVYHVSRAGFLASASRRRSRHALALRNTRAGSRA